MQHPHYGTGNRFAVAIRRSRGGAIVANVDAEEMLECRRQHFIGRLVQDIGENAGLEYIVLQDTVGVILATDNIKSINAINSDLCLVSALENNERKSRLFSFQNRQVFETVQPFVIDGESMGLCHIGLSLEHVLKAEKSAR